MRQTWKRDNFQGKTVQYWGLYITNIHFRSTQAPPLLP
jgi:hypothetical protein